MRAIEKPLNGLHYSVLSPYGLKNLDSPVHNAYHRIEEIGKYANDLARTFPHEVELVRLGQSTENREILGIRIEKVLMICKFSRKDRIESTFSQEEPKLSLEWLYWERSTPVMYVILLLFLGTLLDHIHRPT